MYPDIRWITPLYAFGPGCTHIGVPEKAEPILKEMVHDLVISKPSSLAAIYIPEGTDEIYESVPMRGRVVGAVRLVKIPNGKTIRSYYCTDLDGSMRWPIGWPCVAVYAPDVDDCPILRHHVESYLRDPGSFGNYVARFRLGPFKLEDAMRERLNSDFAQLATIEQ